MAVSLVIAGVGGQGSVLASRIIADAALQQTKGDPGCIPTRVRVGETFGAAMRGGAVLSHVRIGEVLSPLVREGGADLILALEPMEGLRAGVRFLTRGGVVVLNTIPVPPTDVKIGMVDYPATSKIVDALRSLGGTVVTLDATSIAERVGNVRAMNVVMLGAAFATDRIPVGREPFLAAVKARVPSRYLSVNLSAFDEGCREGMRLLTQASGG
jgi:indolepyruvate ferredoxin oxidoreductase beta subunit